MSSQIPPDPITNTFNPGAWDLPELPPAEQALLDTKYVKYPTAQNSLITFPSTITTNGVNTNTLDAIAVGSAQTVGSNLTIGSLTLGGALTSGDITIGNASQTDTIITQNATKTVSNITVSGTTIQTVVGNTDNISSYSTTFNRKNIVSTLATECYKITTTSNYLAQYIELTVSGSSPGVGGFVYKMSFIIENDDPGLRVQNKTVHTSFYNPVYSEVVVSFNIVSASDVRINVLAPFNPSLQAQNYVTTLVAYPTCVSTNTVVVNDYIIEAT